MLVVKIAITATKRPMRKPLQKKIVGFFLFTTYLCFCTGTLTGLSGLGIIGDGTVSLDFEAGISIFIILKSELKYPK